MYHVCAHARACPVCMAALRAPKRQTWVHTDRVPSSQRLGEQSGQCVWPFGKCVWFGKRKSDGEFAQVCDGCVHVSSLILFPWNLHLTPYISEHIPCKADRFEYKVLKNSVVIFQWLQNTCVKIQKVRNYSYISMYGVEGILEAFCDSVVAPVCSCTTNSAQNETKIISADGKWMS